MNITIPFLNKLLQKSQSLVENTYLTRILVGVATIIAIIATLYSYHQGTIVAYGDAESHLNIAKRVVDGLTPGAAQLGGIWLPLPHLMMVPFLIFDPLWRTGLGGSIISGVCFVVSALFIYKLTYLITRDRLSSVIGFTVFVVDPNVLYMQSTPMTEFPLIAFFVLSSYYFIKYIYDDKKYTSLILAALFGFCATLSRYDGWFLVLVEASVLGLMYIFNKKLWMRLQGRIVLFSTLAFFGVLLWLLWGYLILGDPLYFTHSQFSAKSQQQSWLAIHELPAYKNIFVAIQYYTVTAMSNIGFVIFIVSIIGVLFFLFSKFSRQRVFVWLILFAPFFFNVISLFMGQSVIFIRDITPVGYEWRLFNVRYGILMVPAFAFFVGYLFYRGKWQGKCLIAFLMVFQLALFAVGYSRNIDLSDGTVGLSSAKHPQAEQFLAKHYDHGDVLLDDYARTISVLRTNIPMQKVIYIGSKPYWQISLSHPETYARWIVMQKNDDVWTHIYANPKVQGELYKYFKKVYTSPEILIFERNSTPIKTK